VSKTEDRLPLELEAATPWQQGIDRKHLREIVECVVCASNASLEKQPLVYICIYCCWWIGCCILHDSCHMSGSYSLKACNAGVSSAYWSTCMLVYVNLARPTSPIHALIRPDFLCAVCGCYSIRTFPGFCRYWRTSYDWRKAEGEINTLRHFHLPVDNLSVHFIHEVPGMVADCDELHCNSYYNN